MLRVSKSFLILLHCMLLLGLINSGCGCSEDDPADEDAGVDGGDSESGSDGDTDTDTDTDTDSDTDTDTDTDSDSDPVEECTEVQITGVDTIVVDEEASYEAYCMIGGQQVRVTNEVEWTSSDEDVLIVAAGQAAAISVGDAVITATYENSDGTIDGTIDVSVVDAGLTDIIISGAEQMTSVGQTLQLTATCEYGDEEMDCTDTLIWASSDPEVATVDELTGEVTAVATGSATITAQDSETSMSGNTTVVVYIATMCETLTVAVAEEDAAASVVEGQELQLAAFCDYTDGRTGINVTGQVAWASDDPETADVSNSTATIGTVSGIVAGTANITATYTNSDDTTTVNDPAFAVEVTVPVLTGVVVTPAATTITSMDTTVTFVAECSYEGMDEPTECLEAVEWASGNTDVATIDSTSGVATPVANGGPIAITATVGEFSDAAELTVNLTGICSDFQVSAAATELVEGTDVELTATCDFGAGAQDVTGQVDWVSGNPDAATVDAGTVTGVAAGTATITATYESADGSEATDSVELTVVARTLENITISPAVASLNAGDTQEFTAICVYDNDVEEDCPAGVVWAAAEPTIVDITQEGVASPNTANGTTEVTATLGDVTSNPGATVSVNVGPLCVALEVTGAAFVPEGDTTALTATCTWLPEGNPTDVTGSASLTWESSAPAVASVTAGSVEGLAASDTPVTITATYANANQLATEGTAELVVSPGDLESIVITPNTTVTLPLGATQAFTAACFYTNTTGTEGVDCTANVTWESSDTAVVAFNDTANANVAQAVAATNFANITASLVNLAGDTITSLPTRVDATGAQVEAITVYFDSLTSGATLPIDFTQALTVMGTMTNGDVEDVTSGCSFASSSAAATVTSPGGVVTGVSFGNDVIITATHSDGPTDTIDIDVLAVKVERIEVVQDGTWDERPVIEGENVLLIPEHATAGKQLRVIGYLEGHEAANPQTIDLTERAEWSIVQPLYNGASASIENTSNKGLFRGTDAASGTSPVCETVDAVVQATFEALTDTISIDILSRTPDTLTVAFTEGFDGDMPIESTVQMTAEVVFDDGCSIDDVASSADANWDSSTGNATVSDTGLVTGVSDGSATITCTYLGAQDTEIVEVHSADECALSVKDTEDSEDNGIALKIVDSDGARISYDDDSTNIVIPAGYTETFRVMGWYGEECEWEDITNASFINWSTQNDANAVVSDGQVTARNYSRFSQETNIVVETTDNVHEVWTVVEVGAPCIATLSTSASNTNLPVGTSLEMNGTVTFSDSTVPAPTSDAAREAMTEAISWSVRDDDESNLQYLCGYTDISVGGVTYAREDGVDVVEGKVTSLPRDAVPALYTFDGSRILAEEDDFELCPNVTSGELVQTTSITVNDTALASIEVTPANSTVRTGGSVVYKAMATFGTAAPIDISKNIFTSWESSIPALADPNGGWDENEFTAVNDGDVSGTTLITASFDQDEASCNDSLPTEYSTIVGATELTIVDRTMALTTVKFAVGADGSVDSACYTTGSGPNEVHYFPGHVLLDVICEGEYSDGDGAENVVNDPAVSLQVTSGTNVVEYVEKLETEAGWVFRVHTLDPSGITDPSATLTCNNTSHPTLDLNSMSLKIFVDDRTLDTNSLTITPEVSGDKMWVHGQKQFDAVGTWTHDGTSSSCTDTLKVTSLCTWDADENYLLIGENTGLAEAVAQQTQGVTIIAEYTSLTGTTLQGDSESIIIDGRCAVSVDVDSPNPAEVVDGLSEQYDANIIYANGDAVKVTSHSDTTWEDVITNAGTKDEEVYARAGDEVAGEYFGYQVTNNAMPVFVKYAPETVALDADPDSWWNPGDEATPPTTGPICPNLTTDRTHSYIEGEGEINVMPATVQGGTITCKYYNASSDSDDHSVFTDNVGVEGDTIPADPENALINGQGTCSVAAIMSDDWQVGSVTSTGITSVDWTSRSGAVFVEDLGNTARFVALEEGSANIRAVATFADADSTTETINLSLPVGDCAINIDDATGSEILPPDFTMPGGFEVDYNVMIDWGDEITTCAPSIDWQTLVNEYGWGYGQFDGSDALTFDGYRAESPETVPALGIQGKVKFYYGVGALPDNEVKLVTTDINITNDTVQSTEMCWCGLPVTTDNVTDYCPQKTAFLLDMADDGLVNNPAIFTCQNDLGVADTDPSIHVGQTHRYFAIGDFGDDFYLPVTNKCDSFSLSGNGVSRTLDEEAGLLNVTGVAAGGSSISCVIAGTTGSNISANFDVSVPCVERLAVELADDSAPSLYPEQVPVAFKAQAFTSNEEWVPVTDNANLTWGTTDSSALETLATKGLMHTRVDGTSSAPYGTDVSARAILDDSTALPLCWDYFNNSDDSGYYHSDEIEVNKDLGLDEIYFNNAPADAWDTPIAMHRGEDVTYTKPVIVYGVYSFEGETTQTYTYDITLADDINWVESDTNKVLVTAEGGHVGAFEKMHAIEVGEAIVAVSKTVKSNSDDYILGWTFVLIDDATVTKVDAQVLDIMTNCNSFDDGGYIYSDNANELAMLPQGGISTTLRAMPTYSDGSTPDQAVDVTWSLVEAADSAYLTVDSATGVITTSEQIAASVCQSAEGEFEVGIRATYSAEVFDEMTVIVNCNVADGLLIDRPSHENAPTGVDLDLGREYQAKSMIEVADAGGTVAGECYIVTNDTTWTGGTSATGAEILRIDETGKIQTVGEGTTSIRGTWSNATTGNLVQDLEENIVVEDF